MRTSRNENKTSGYIHWWLEKSLSLFLQRNIKNISIGTDLSIVFPPHPRPSRQKEIISLSPVGVDAHSIRYLRGENKDKQKIVSQQSWNLVWKK